MLATTLAVVLNVLTVGYLFRRQEALREKSQEELKDWLFKSLYTIDKGVKKPGSIDEIKKNSKKAEIYSPTQDPMSEFGTIRSDFYE